MYDFKYVKRCFTGNWQAWSKNRHFSFHYAQISNFPSKRPAVAKTAFLTTFEGLNRKSLLYVALHCNVKF